jgi:hypothetical protein
VFWWGERALTRHARLSFGFFLVYQRVVPVDYIPCSGTILMLSTSRPGGRNTAYSLRVFSPRISTKKRYSPVPECSRDAEANKSAGVNGALALMAASSGACFV